MRDKLIKSPEYARAFDSFMRGGASNLTPEDEMLVALGTRDGGVRVSQKFYDALADAMKHLSAAG